MTITRLHGTWAEEPVLYSARDAHPASSHDRQGHGETSNEMGHRSYGFVCVVLQPIDPLKRRQMSRFGTGSPSLHRLGRRCEIQRQRDNRQRTLSHGDSRVGFDVARLWPERKYAGNIA